MSNQQHTPDPFGFFKAEPFCWTDCAETDEGAQPLFDQAAIDAISKQRDELLAALERLSFAALCRDSTMGDPCRLIEVKAELAAANVQAQEAIASVKDQCGRVNSGHACTMPAGSKCPDCGPGCHSVPEGA